MFKKSLLTVGALGAMSAPAWAVMDVTAVTGSVSDASTAIGTVGGLVLAAIALAAAFKWVRRAL